MQKLTKRFRHHREVFVMWARKNHGGLVLNQFHDHNSQIHHECAQYLGY